jgi:hypothetical protein
MFCYYKFLKSQRQMKRLILTSLFTAFFSLASCIDRFEPEGIASQDGILVVDGIITDDTTVVELHWSVPMDLEEWYKAPVVDGATLYVECSDGTRFNHVSCPGDGVYKIATGKLRPSRQYRLHIALDGREYESEYLSPLFSPEIDSVSWQKRGEGEPVYITVSTHGDDSEAAYYRWTYQEDWEFKSELFAHVGRLNGVYMNFSPYTPNNIYYCWGSSPSRTFVLATTDRLSGNVISHKRLVEMEPGSEKMSELYHISVSQYRIRKASYDYFLNLQKNVSQTGSLFSPVPSEMKGNVRCLTSPGEWVVGFVEVSVPSVRAQFMPELILAYEPPEKTCFKAISTYDGALYSPGPPTLYAPIRCVDCTTRGTKNKPAFWPTDHW